VDSITLGILLGESCYNWLKDCQQLLDTLAAPSTVKVDKLYRQLGEILATAAVQQAKCSL
jgi:hypothetical protein